LKMLQANQLSTKRANQLLPLKNKLNKLRMVSQSRPLETRFKKLKNKLSKHLKFSKKNRKRKNQLLWLMIKVNLKILRESQSSMIQESQLLLQKNRLNKLKMVSQLRLLESKLKRLKTKSIKPVKY